MSYYTGSVVAAPVANKEKYLDHAAEAWPSLRSLGATRMVETWGVDVPDGETTDFRRAVEATDDEAVVFSWIEWPDKATADAAWRRMRDDPATRSIEMPFDGKRMIYGGFAPVFARGDDGAAGYVQGFVLAVPEREKDAYAALCADSWRMFEKAGARAAVETWGEDVPRGARTDFYRATRAEDGEVPVFSWIVWPDRATCDAAGAAMEADASIDMAKMPFDARRMMSAGFEPLYDSRPRA